MGGFEKMTFFESKSLEVFLCFVSLIPIEIIHKLVGTMISIQTLGV